MTDIVYKGKVAQSGNSESLRFEKPLFKSLPQFAQGADLLATPLSDDVILVRVNMPEQPNESYDPVMNVFLDFLEKDMVAHPETITPIDQDEMDEIAELVAGVKLDE